MRELGDTELRVLLAVVRKTIGWQKSKDILSISQLCEITGASNRSVINAVATLEERKMIRMESQGSGRGTRRSFELWVEENSAESSPIFARNGEESSPIPTGNGEKSSHTKENKTKKEEKEKADPSDQRLITDLFQEKFMEKSGGSKPTWLNQDFASIKRILKQHSVSEVLEVIRAYFDEDHWFTKKDGYRFASMMRFYDEIKSSRKVTGREATDADWDRQLKEHLAARGNG